MSASEAVIVMITSSQVPETTPTRSNVRRQTQATSQRVISTRQHRQQPPQTLSPLPHLVECVGPSPPACTSEVKLNLGTDCCWSTRAAAAPNTCTRHLAQRFWCCCCRPSTTTTPAVVVAAPNSPTTPYSCDASTPGAPELLQSWQAECTGGGTAARLIACRKRLA